MSKFDVLGTMRCVRDDSSLSASEKSFLLCAALRGNEQGRVRASQEILAKDAGLSSSTVKRLYRTGLLERFFEITREGRQVNLTWKGVMVIQKGVMVIQKGVTMTPEKVSPRHLKGVTMTPHLPLSTSASTSSSTSPSTPAPSEMVQEAEAARRGSASLEKFLRNYG